MQVELGLKTWRIEAEKGEQMVKGHYSIMYGGKEIATQAFNDGYSGKDVKFTADVVAKIKELEAAIKEELRTVLC